MKRILQDGPFIIHQVSTHILSIKRFWQEVKGSICTTLRLHDTIRRKIPEGYLRGLGIENTVSAIRILDKLDKIGEKGVLSLLQSEMTLTGEVALRCLALAEIRTTDLSSIERVRALGMESALLSEGLEELEFVLNALSALPKGTILADLSIARGLDYYTGTVYETKLREFPNYPTVCAGGRYENLTGAFINRKLPGVGMTLELTRLFAKPVAEKHLRIGPKCPTQILVIFSRAERREENYRIADGKIVARWSSQDTLSWAMQVGLKVQQ